MDQAGVLQQDSAGEGWDLDTITALSTGIRTMVGTFGSLMADEMDSATRKLLNGSE